MGCFQPPKHVVIQPSRGLILYSNAGRFNNLAMMAVVHPGTVEDEIIKCMPATYIETDMENLIHYFVSAFISVLVLMVHRNSS